MIMAHVIKDTPILRGVDAENFVRNLYAEKKPDKKRQERMAKKGIIHSEFYNIN